MSPGEWGLLIAALVALVAGVVTGAWIAAGGHGSSSRAHAVLAERYASGEISSEEFDERRTTLGPAATRAGWWPLSVAMVAIGVLGAILVLAFAPDWSMMDGPMMGGGMGSMMGGETGRDADPPKVGADEKVVTAREFAFSPSTLEARSGETVNITLDNEGAMYHTLTVSALDFELRANGGDEVSGALTASRPGRYEFICAAPGHAGQGVTGVLVVR